MWSGAAASAAWGVSSTPTCQLLCVLLTFAQHSDHAACAAAAAAGLPSLQQVPFGVRSSADSTVSVLGAEHAVATPGSTRFRARHTISRGTADELLFRKGETIVVVEQPMHGWWRGYREEDVTKHMGKLYKGFMVEAAELCDAGGESGSAAVVNSSPAGAAEMGAVSPPQPLLARARTTSLPPPPPPHPTRGILDVGDYRRFIATHTVSKGVSKQSTDLAFEKGTVVIVTRTPVVGWWYGCAAAPAPPCPSHRRRCCCCHSCCVFLQHHPLPAPAGPHGIIQTASAGTARGTGLPPAACTASSSKALSAAGISNCHFV